jgi:hypothetical protein
MRGMGVLLTVVLTGYGVYLVLACFLPGLRSKGFHHWSVSDGGSSIEFLGFFEKVIRPPKVIAEGEMSEKTAVRVYLSIGFLLITIGSLVFRHITGTPVWFPDVVQKLFG